MLCLGHTCIAPWRYSDSLFSVDAGDTVTAALGARLTKPMPVSVAADTSCRSLPTLRPSSAGESECPRAQGRAGLQVGSCFLAEVLGRADHRPTRAWPPVSGGAQSCLDVSAGLCGLWLVVGTLTPQKCGGGCVCPKGSMLLLNSSLPLTLSTFLPSQ